MRVRQVRVLIYEGPRDWVQGCVNSGNNFVKDRKVLGTIGDTGEEFMSITEHISPAIVIQEPEPVVRPVVDFGA